MTPSALRCGRSRSFACEDNAMKFMFTIYHDENVLNAMPEKEMQALVDSAIEYAEEIRRSGHYIASDALQRTRTARTIRIRAGKVSTTVGSFVETKEQGWILRHRGQGHGRGLRGRRELPTGASRSDRDSAGRGA